MGDLSKDYTEIVVDGFTTLKKPVAVNRTTCQVRIFIATTRMWVYLSITKVGVSVMVIITWRAFTKEIATNSIASKNSSVAA